MATALGIAGANALIRFDTATPGTIVASTPITGLFGGDTLVGLDFRPATGQLFGLGSGSRLYTIDPVTAVATQVGVNGAFALSGGAFGFDFNPVPDRLRLTSDLDQNLRLNPNDGTLTATDGTLAFAAGDPNAAADPNVVASAYTNSFGGATATTLYDLDSTLDTLVIQNPPNAGTLNTVVGAGLGVDIQGVAGFDIQALAGGGNAAFAALTTDGTTSSLYTIDLTTGAATQVGPTPIGGAAPLLLRALAVAPFGSFQFSAPTYSVGESGTVATITVNRIQGSEGIATVRLTTSNGTATAPADYTAFDQVLIFGPGVTTQSVQIRVVDNGLDEADVTVNLTLTTATGGAVLGTQPTAVLTIVDDDSAPVATDDTYTTAEDTALTVVAPGVLANDADPDGDPMTVLLVSGPSHGALSLNADGSFTYTPDANYNGLDSFTYRANDGTLNSNVAVVSLTVNAVNDLPTATGLAFSATQGTPVVDVAVASFNDADRDQAALFTALINWGDGSAPTAGRVRSTTGGYVVVGSHVFDAPGTFPVTVTIGDPGGGQTVASGTATVAPIPVQSQLGGSLNSASDSGVLGDQITNDNTPTFTGTAPPGHRVTLFATGPGGPMRVGQGVADAGGNYSVTSLGLPDGTYAFGVAATDPIATGPSLVPTTGLGSITIDTVAPRISGVSLDPRSGRILVAFQDGGSGMDLAGVQDTANYAVDRPFSLYVRHRRVRVTSVGATPDGRSASLFLNAGRRLMRARLILRVLSAGITDRAGNALDGEFRGVAPSGDGMAGGDFVARLGTNGRRGSPPAPVSFTQTDTPTRRSAVPASATTRPWPSSR